MTPPGPAPDRFGGRAPKLAFLGGVPSSTSVALVGRAGEAWLADFATHFGASRVTRDLGPGPRGQPWGLAVLAPDGEGGRTVAHWIRQVSLGLADTGMVALLVRNRAAIPRALRHAGVHWWRSPGTTWAFRRWLAANGFRRYVELTAIPSFARPEEFTAATTGAGPWGLRARFADGYLYLAARPGGGLWRRLDQLAALAGLGPSPPPSLARIDLRERGALLVTVRSGGARRLCRVAATPEVGPLLDWNSTWLGRLQALGGRLARLVPLPIATASLEGHGIHVESGMPGAIAWRALNSAPARRRALEELVTFLLELEAATARPGRLDPTTFEKLIAFPPPGVAIAPPPPLASLLQEIFARLHALVGTDVTIVSAHGDFGFGNALVEPRSGSLTAVVDWDTGREHELVGVDLTNLLVQRLRIEQRLSLGAAADRVGAALIRDGFDPWLPGVTPSRLRGQGADLTRQVLRLAAVRFVQRSLRYPAILQRDLADLVALLRWAVTL